MTRWILAVAALAAGVGAVLLLRPSPSPSTPPVRRRAALPTSSPTEAPARRLIRTTGPEEAAPAARRPPAPPAPEPDPGVLPNPVFGPAEAPVRLVAVLDVQCPFSRQLVEQLTALVHRQPPFLRLVLVHFPQPQHDRADAAARAVLAADAQGSGWDMLTRLFENPGSLTEEDLTEHARALGLDLATFDTSRHGVAATRRLDSWRAALFRLRGGATPTVFVNGKRIADPLDELTTAIADARADGRPRQLQEREHLGPGWDDYSRHLLGSEWQVSGLPPQSTGWWWAQADRTIHTRYAALLFEDERCPNCEIVAKRLDELGQDVTVIRLPHPQPRTPGRPLLTVADLPSGERGRMLRSSQLASALPGLGVPRVLLGRVRKNTPDPPLDPALALSGTALAGPVLSGLVSMGDLRRTLTALDGKVPDGSPRRPVVLGPVADESLLDDGETVVPPPSGRWPLRLFVDHECRASAAVVTRLRQDPRLALTLSAFPLAAHPLARRAAEAVAASPDPAAAHARLFELGGVLDEAALDSLARGDGPARDRVNRAIALGRALGVTSTPAAFLAGRPINIDPMFPAESVDAAIEALQRSGRLP